MKKLINKMTFVFFTALIGLVYSEMQGYRITIRNLTSSGIRLGVNANTTKARCDFVRWDTTGYPDKKLPSGESVTPINFTGWCGDACWKYINLYLTNSAGVNKLIVIPFDVGCDDFTLDLNQHGNTNMLELDITAVNWAGKTFNNTIYVQAADWQ